MFADGLPSIWISYFESIIECKLNIEDVFNIPITLKEPSDMNMRDKKPDTVKTLCCL